MERRAVRHGAGASTDEARRGPFLVHAARLRRDVGASRPERVVGHIADLAALGVRVPDDAEIQVDAELVSYAGGITVDGTVTTVWEAECRRCGEPVSGELRTAVRERYTPEGGTADEDAYALDGDDLDLEPLARDAVLLSLPLPPLCREDCRGLCPQCGADRNVEECSCEPPRDPRWAALDALRGGGAEGGA